MKSILSSLLLLGASVPLLHAQATIGGCPVLPANNIWNTRIDHLPVASNSATLVNTIGTGKYVHADFGSGTWNGGPIGIPFVTVPGTQQKYPATFLYWDESDPGPYAVPLNAPIEGGPNATGDRHAIAIDTTNCILYELYAAYPQASSWRGDSGAIYNLRSNALRPNTWTSADAAGLPIVPGLVTYEEVASGEIKHAIRFTVPQSRRAYVWPARHYASSLTGTQYPRMGERFRLKASFDISGFPADVRVILTAMKKYGIILADNGSAWYISGKPDERWNNSNLRRLHEVFGSAFEAVDATPLMVDPNSGEAKQSGVNVVVAPASPTIYAGQNQQFTATVTGAANTAVSWSVDGVAGGSAARGFIDASGLYMAPTSLPSPAQVVITATTVATPAVSASTTATISSYPNITSWSPNPIVTSSFVFTLTGTGFRQGAVIKFNGANVATTWLSATQVRGNGTATPTSRWIPVTVTNPDGLTSNIAYMLATVPAGGPIAVTVTPNPITMKSGTNRWFIATVANTTNKDVTWKVNGITGGNTTYGTITYNGYYRTPASVPAAGLKITITAISSADPTKSGSAKVTVIR